MTKYNNLLSLGILVLALAGSPALASKERDEGRFVRDLASKNSLEVSLRGELSCESKITSNEGEAMGCASIQLTDQASGENIRLSGTTTLSKLLKGGILQVSIKGIRSAQVAGDSLSTVQVKQIILE